LFGQLNISANMVKLLTMKRFCPHCIGLIHITQCIITVSLYQRKVFTLFYSHSINDHVTFSN